MVERAKYEVAGLSRRSGRIPALPYPPIKRAHCTTVGGSAFYHGDRPDPIQVWWKARLLERWNEERRARIPITVMQPIEIAASPMGAVWLFYSSLSCLFRAFAG
jgi:hypothetical protein